MIRTCITYIYIILIFLLNLYNIYYNHNIRYLKLENYRLSADHHYYILINNDVMIVFFNFLKVLKFNDCL